MTIGKKTKEALAGEFILSRKRVTLTTGQALRIAREKNKLTQTQLARLTGIPQANLSALENDEATLGADRARVLARALHVHPAVLLFPDWEEEKKWA